MENNKLYNKEELKEYFTEQLEAISFYNEISRDFYGDYENYIDSSNYICDAITEYADQKIDIYHSDLLEWAKYNWEYVNNAISEFGACDDIINQIQQGQYLQYTEQLNEDIQQIIKKLAYYNILQKLENIDTIERTAEQIKNFELALEDIDDNDNICKINDAIIDFLGVQDE